MIRRARPLLGTIVAISADAPAVALDRAFAAVERVHVLMSAQRRGSDVDRINREAWRGPVSVDPWTLAVLGQALEISAASDGAFDVVLPGSGARYTDIALEPSCCIALRRRAKIDVSGIAKGFAVDMAVDVLLAHGASAGNVNAGGDLRFFGGWTGPVRVRTPGMLGSAVYLPRCAHKAFATSSGYFGTALDDPRSGARTALDWSVTIAAARCLVADALTKVVALLGPDRALLNHFNATAFAVDANGQLHAAAG